VQSYGQSSGDQPFAGFETIEAIVRKMNHPTASSNDDRVLR
jgi:hypothetical protein